MVERVLQAPPDQSLGVFTSVIVIVTLGSVVVTIQAKVSISAFYPIYQVLTSSLPSPKLLGGRVSVSCHTFHLHKT